MATPRSTGLTIIVVLIAVLGGIALIREGPSNRDLIMLSAGIFLILFFVGPEKLLLVYLVISPLVDQLIPFFTQITGSGGRFGPQILLRGGLTLLFVVYLVMKSKNLVNLRAIRPMAMILLLITISTLASGVMVRQGIVSLAKIAFWMLMVPTIADMVAKGKMKINTIYWCVISSVLVFSVSLLVAHYVLGKNAYYKGAGIRLSGLFTIHSVSISLSMGLLVIIAIAITHRNTFVTLLLGVFSILVVNAIMRTYMRTAYVAVAGGLLMLSLGIRLYGRGEDLRREKLRLGIVFAIMIVSVVVYAYENIEVITDRLFGDFTAYEEVGSGRLVIYVAAFKTYDNYSIFQKLFGEGLGRAFSFRADQLGRATHNDFIAILLSGGLLGLYLYLWIFISLWKQIKPVAQSSCWPCVIAFAIIAVYMFSAMTGVPMFTVSVMGYFSFLVGGAIGYYNVVARDNRTHVIDPHENEESVKTLPVVNAQEDTENPGTGSVGVRLV